MRAALVRDGAVSNVIVLADDWQDAASDNYYPLPAGATLLLDTTGVIDMADAYNPVTRELRRVVRDDDGIPTGTRRVLVIRTADVKVR